MVGICENDGVTDVGGRKFRSQISGIWIDAAAVVRTVREEKESQKRESAERRSEKRKSQRREIQ